MLNFAAIDFETANNERTSVCSVGVVVVRNGEFVDSFYSLIQPDDEGCLRAVMRCYQMDDPGYRFYCTCQAARRVFPHAPNHQLHTVAALCGYHLEHHHHALADAEACAWIARKIIPEEPSKSE